MQRSNFILALVIIIGVSWLTVVIFSQKAPAIKAPAFSIQPIQKATQMDSNQSVSKATNDQIMQQYRALLLNAFTAHEVLAFINQYIPQVPPEQADEMLIGLEELQKSRVRSYQINLEKTSNLEELSLKAQEEGILIKKTNETMSVAVDYSQYYKYDPYITQPMKDYLRIQNTENTLPAAIAGKLSISKDELLTRLSATETFINKYSDYRRMKPIYDLYLTYKQYT